MKTGLTLLLFGTTVLAGCRTNNSGESENGHEPIVTVIQDGQNIPIYFPEYLLIEDARLGRHGHIPGTPLVGANMAVDKNLVSVQQYYMGELELRGWSMDREEQGDDAFWVIYSQDEASVELRAVQGTAGPTHLFLLYTPPSPRNL